MTQNDINVLNKLSIDDLDDLSFYIGKVDSSNGVVIDEENIWEFMAWLDKAKKDNIEVFDYLEDLIKDNGLRCTFIDELESAISDILSEIYKFENEGMPLNSFKDFIEVLKRLNKVLYDGYNELRELYGNRLESLDIED